MAHRLDSWIDQFQSTISFPLGVKIARHCRVPLIGLKDLVKVPYEAPYLTVVLGPFEVVHDSFWSYWHAVKAVVGGISVASVVCRMSNRGDGGIHVVKLWHNDPGRFSYHSMRDPEQFMPPDGPNGVDILVSEHLAAEYHVGFPEDASARIADDAIVANSQPLLQDEQERLRRQQQVGPGQRQQSPEPVERALPLGVKP